MLAILSAKANVQGMDAVAHTLQTDMLVSATPTDAISTRIACKFRHACLHKIPFWSPSRADCI